MVQPNPGATGTPGRPNLTEALRDGEGMILRWLDKYGYAVRFE